MKIVRGVAVVVLAFVSITAIMGAVQLMQDPLGHPMNIPLSDLKHSGFHSFMIPGIMLLVVNGLLGLAVLGMAVFCKRGYGRWIAFQGCVLFGWMTIEVILVRKVVWLHCLYWALGLILIAAGWVLHRKERSVEVESSGPVAALPR